MINDLLFILLLCIFLFIIYRRIHGIDNFGSIRSWISGFSRKARERNYIKDVSRKPLDSQKYALREASILVAVLFIMFLLVSKTIFFTAVISGSMRPVFDKDDLVLMQNMDQKYRVGDIIMFMDPFTNRPYTHRIVSITNKGIRTKGDAMGVMDGWTLKKENIIGKAIIIQGKPVVIAEYGKFFIIEEKRVEYASVFGEDYRKYVMFIQILRIYGYVIALLALFLYIALTARHKKDKVDNIYTRK